MEIIRRCDTEDIIRQVNAMVEAERTQLCKLKKIEAALSKMRTEMMETSNKSNWVAEERTDRDIIRIYSLIEYIQSENKVKRCCVREIVTSLRYIAEILGIENEIKGDVQ